MEYFNILPLAEPVNEEVTHVADGQYREYIAWLKENGCIYPSVLDK